METCPPAIVLTASAARVDGVAGHGERELATRPSWLTFWTIMSTKTPASAIAWKTCAA